MNQYAEGYSAYQEGIKLIQNPYNATELLKRSEWTKGWMAAKMNTPIYRQDCY